MWKRLRRFKALEPAAQRMFVRAALLLPLVSLSLRFRGFRATQGTLQGLISSKSAKNQLATGTRGGEEAAQQSLQRTARMVGAAARYIWPGSTCLESSLALCWLLVCGGIAPELRIGTRKRAGKFEAHAWVEVDGAAVNESKEVHTHYAVFEAEFSSLAEAR